ncbi:unnamed protein product [Chrysoparadoxa australica]
MQRESTQEAPRPRASAEVIDVSDLEAASAIAELENWGSIRGYADAPADDRIAERQIEYLTASLAAHTKPASDGSSGSGDSSEEQGSGDVIEDHPTNQNESTSDESNSSGDVIEDNETNQDESTSDESTSSGDEDTSVETIGGMTFLSSKVPKIS